MRKKTGKLDGPFKVGRHVTFRIGQEKFNAVIVEDRGHIGKAGRQILRIKTMNSNPDLDPDSTFEMPAEELTLSQ